MVCVTRSVADVQWGRGESCSNGHVTLYSGRVMGERDTHYRASTLCVDNALEGHYASSAGDENGTYERNWTALRELLMHGPCPTGHAHMPRRTTTRLTVPRASATCAGYLLYLAEMRLGSIDESAYPADTEPGCSLCGVPA